MAKTKQFEPCLELRAYLAYKGISYIGISRYVGIHPVSFGNKVNGYTDWSLEETKRVKEFLNLDQETYCKLFNIFFEK